MYFQLMWSVTLRWKVHRWTNPKQSHCKMFRVGWGGGGAQGAFSWEHKFSFIHIFHKHDILWRGTWRVLAIYKGHVGALPYVYGQFHGKVDMTLKFQVITLPKKYFHDIFINRSNIFRDIAKNVEEIFSVIQTGKMYT